MTPEWISTFEVADRDIIVLHTEDLPDEVVTDIINAIHEHFPGNMILMLGLGETVEARSESEIKELLQAVLDHEEYRDHKELTGDA